MPMLEDKFHCIAPDYPGFGNTDSPSREEFAYTFDHLAEYWKNPTKELREQYKSAFARDTVYRQYTFGTQEGSVSPDGYSLDLYYASIIEDYDEKQSDLIFDYQNNVT